MLLKAQENLTIVQRPTSSLKPSGRKYKFRNGSIQYIQNPLISHPSTKPHQKGEEKDQR